MESNFEILRHARKVTPKFEQRTKYLADTLATLQEYHKRANAKKQRTLHKLIVRYTDMLDICQSRIAMKGI